MVCTVELSGALSGLSSSLPAKLHGQFSCLSACLLDLNNMKICRSESVGYFREYAM